MTATVSAPQNLTATKAFLKLVNIVAATPVTSKML